MAPAVGAYEAKRLRRMAENRLKLQSLGLEPKLRVPTKKRKRKTDEKPQEPARESSRLRKLEKQQHRKAEALREMEKQTREERQKDNMERKGRDLQAALEYA